MIITKKKELMEFLEKKPEVPHDKKELVLRPLRPHTLDAERPTN